ncbi:MAG: hypothetical protein SNH01_05435 [Rikenellaceae bacterium]
MKRVIYTLVLIFASITASMSMTEHEEIELIKSRYRQYYAGVAPQRDVIRGYQ